MPLHYLRRPDPCGCCWVHGGARARACPFSSVRCSPPATKSRSVAWHCTAPATISSAQREHAVSAHEVDGFRRTPPFCRLVVVLEPRPAPSSAIEFLG